MIPAEHIRKLLNGAATEKEREHLMFWLNEQSGENHVFGKQLIQQVPDDKGSITLNESTYRLNRQHRRRWKRKRTILLLSIACFIILVNLSIFLALVPHPAPEASFHDATLAQVVTYLETQYLVTIVVQNRKLLQCRITCTLFHEDSIDEIIRQVAKTLHAESKKIKNETFVINGEECKGT